MRGVEKAVTAAAGIFISIACATTAIDANASTGTKNGVTVNVVGQPPAFPPSISATEPSYAAYLITVINGTQSSLNNYRFRATLLTPGAEFSNTNPVQKDYAVCTLVSPVELDCAVGYNGLITKESSASFHVQIKTPTLDQAATQTTPTQTTPTPSVFLNWNVRPGDGASTDYIFPSAPEQTPLSTDSPTGDAAKVASVVPPITEGYFIYTGVQATPVGNDKHTSSAKIKSVEGNLVYASITEGVIGSTLCPSTTTKFCSQFNVETQKPGEAPKKAEFIQGDTTNSTLADKLVITLRFDNAALAPYNLNANNLVLYYRDDLTGTTTEVRNCPSKKSSYVPTESTSPCVFSRTTLSRKLGQDLAGDAELVIYAIRNGMFLVD